MKTKLRFKVVAPKYGNSIFQGQIKGWQMLQTFGMGISNDKDNTEQFNLSFFNEPDNYCKIENTELEEYKANVKELLLSIQKDIEKIKELVEIK